MGHAEAFHACLSPQHYRNSLLRANARLRATQESHKRTLLEREQLPNNENQEIPNCTAAPAAAGSLDLVAGHAMIKLDLSAVQHTSSTDDQLMQSFVGLAVAEGKITDPRFKNRTEQ